MMDDYRSKISVPNLEALHQPSSPSSQLDNNGKRINRQCVTDCYGPVRRLSISLLSNTTREACNEVGRVKIDITGNTHLIKVDSIYFGQKTDWLTKMLFGALILSIFLCANANITILASWKDNKFQVLKRFWTNTGFSPLGDAETRIKYLLSYDEKVNLALIGAVPNEGITHVRIHWILDLVTVREIQPEGPVFDYKHLDELIGWMHEHRLVPTFELMGNPSNYFHDFGIQFDDWSRLIKEILSRYIDMYDAVYLYNWRFELMNEPDLKLYNTYNFTLPEYLNYFKASERFLGKLQGPAGLFRNREKHILCWGLLDYCNMNPCKLSMVTFHKKGDGVGSKIIRQSLDLIKSLQMALPNMTDIAFGNDEADIMTGWHKPFEWRADVRYASMVLQVIIGHVNEMHVKRNINFQLLSNDNAFMNYWPNYFTQRTLLARFQMNNTEPPHVQFFRKPVYSVMGLLSLLGCYVVDIQYTPSEDGLSYIMTAEKYRTNFLGTVTNNHITNEVYTRNRTKLNIATKILLDDTSNVKVYALYTMDNFNTNPYQVWTDGGRPDFPDKPLRRKMRHAEELKRFYYKTVEPYKRKVSISLPETFNPTIFAINICDMRYPAPGGVENLHFVKINSNEVLLLWSDASVKSKCLLTYVVQFKNVEDSGFRRINYDDTIFLSFHFDGTLKEGETSILGEYRVAAVDYFGRYGQFSEILKISKL